jgi:hypothetical protein
MALPGRGLIGSYDIFEIEVAGQIDGDGEGLPVVALGVQEGRVHYGVLDKCGEAGSGNDPRGMVAISLGHWIRVLGLG